MTNSALVLMNEGLKHWVNKIRSLKLRILTRQIRCADQVHQAARSKVSLTDTGRLFMRAHTGTVRAAFFGFCGGIRFLQGQQTGRLSAVSTAKNDTLQPGELL